MSPSGAQRKSVAWLLPRAPEAPASWMSEVQNAPPRDCQPLRPVQPPPQAESQQGARQRAHGQRQKMPVRQALLDLAATRLLTRCSGLNPHPSAAARAWHTLATTTALAPQALNQHTPHATLARWPRSRTRPAPCASSAPSAPRSRAAAPNGPTHRPSVSFSRLQAGVCLMTWQLGGPVPQPEPLISPPIGAALLLRRRGEGAMPRQSSL